MRHLALPLAGLAFVACLGSDPQRPPAPRERVGRGTDGRQTTPVNQTLTPRGQQLDLPGLRPQVLAASPDGRFLYTSGKTSELLVVDAENGTVAQRVALPSDAQLAPLPPNAKEQKPDKDGQASYTGLCVAKDGRTLWLANVRGSIKVFTVDEQGVVKPSHSLPLPKANAPLSVAWFSSFMFIHSA